MASRMFESLATSTFQLRLDEAATLLAHYDPMGRQDLRVADFLDDVKDLVQDTGRRLELIDILTSFSAGGQRSDSLPFLRQQYQKDFEEMHKVMAANKTSCYQWFQIYAKGRPSLTPQELQPALQALGLSRQFTASDYQNLVALLGSQGVVEIRAIEEAIRLAVASTSDAQLQEDIIERVATTFRGDDVFIGREIQKND